MKDGQERDRETSAAAPEPVDPSWSRLSRSPLPAYAYLPGRSPHPRRDPDGHSYGLPEPRASRVAPDGWRRLDLYLHGIDCYNLGYFWECHEAFEALWHASGDPITRDFFQGLIQLAAADIKWRVGAEGSARALITKSLGRLSSVPAVYMGLALAELRDAARAFCDAIERGDSAPPRPAPPPLRLAEPLEDGALTKS